MRERYATLVRNKNRGGASKKAQDNRELAALSAQLHPLFPHMTAAHYIDAASNFLEYGDREAARSMLAEAKLHMDDAHRAGEHLLGRLFQLRAEVG